MDIEDAHDYYEIIKEPICLTEIMNKIDSCLYSNKQSFLDDIEQIRFNALEYNPEKDLEGAF